MRRTVQHSFGSSRSVKHAFGLGATEPNTHYILDNATNSKWYLTSDQAVAAYMAAMNTPHGVFETVVASLNPDTSYKCGSRCPVPGNSITLTAKQYAAADQAVRDAIISKSANPYGIGRGVPGSASKIPRKPQHLVDVSTQSIRSVLSKGQSSKVGVSYATDPALAKNDSVITSKGDSIPDASQITSVGTKSIDPAFSSPMNPLSVHATLPDGSTVVIDNPVPITGSISQPEDNKIFGMSPGVAMAVGVGAAALIAYVVMKK